MHDDGPGFGIGLDQLPKEKQDAVKQMLVDLVKVVERGMRDFQNNLDDLREAVAADDLPAMLAAHSAIQAADQRWGMEQKNAEAKMFERMSGRPMHELLKLMDGEGGFLRAVGLLPADGEDDPDTTASGSSSIPGIDMSSLADHKPDPSGLDAGDIVRYKEGTNGRQGMLISHPRMGKADVRWFGDGAPDEPQEEDLSALERVEGDEELDGIRQQD